MATTPPPLTPFGGTAPQRGDKATFSGRVDAFVTWLIAVVTQFVALAANVYANAQEAFTSAGMATSAAATAAATANATPWVSGATIQQYAAVISPADGRTYRRTAAAGSSTTDPSLDIANYVMLSGQTSTMSLLANYTVSSAVANIDFISLFAATYDKYVIEIQGAAPSFADSPILRLANGGAIDTASNYFAGGSDNTVMGATTAFFLTPNIVGITGSTTLTVEIANANSASKDKAITSRGSFTSSNPDRRSVMRSGTYSGGAASGFRLFWNSAANFTAGTVRVYGIKNT